MNTLAKPAIRPARPQFSSGPTVKHPGWSLSNLQAAPLGRSHRSKIGKGRLAMFGPQVLFRGQAHGTFKLVFNGIVQASVKQ